MQLHEHFLDKLIKEENNIHSDIINAMTGRQPAVGKHESFIKMALKTSRKSIYYSKLCYICRWISAVLFSVLSFITSSIILIFLNTNYPSRPTVRFLLQCIAEGLTFLQNGYLWMKSSNFTEAFGALYDLLT